MHKDARRDDALADSNDIDNDRVPLSPTSFAQLSSPRLRRRSEQGAWIRMDDLAGRGSTGSTAKQGVETQEIFEHGAENGTTEGSRAQQRDGIARSNGAIGEEEVADGTREVPGQRKRWRLGRKNHSSYSHTHYRVYKRRWFGLVQLVLLNIVVSWGVSVYCGWLGTS